MIKKNIYQRDQFPILVVDAEERMSVAVVRSLGRAGYPVHACSVLAYAAGGWSNFAARRDICPPYDSQQFLPWLRQYCIAHEIRCLVPTEPLLLAIRPVFHEFAAILPLSGSEDTVYRGINKFDLFHSLQQQLIPNMNHAEHLPPLMLLRRGDELPTNDVLAKLGEPFFLKIDGDYSADGESTTYRARTAAEALALARQLFETSDRLVLQGYVPAIGVGAFLLRWNGKILAEFMHIRLHEIPLQGWSSFRKSWRHEEILSDAKAKLNSLRWEGVAMMEYRWNPVDGRFALIEMNGRFWGSLHLALYAGVDFPALLVDAFRGADTGEMPTASIDVKSRDPILEAKYVLSQFKNKDLTLVGKLRVAAEYIRLSFDPRVKSDSLFPGDRSLFLWQCWQYCAESSQRFFKRENQTSNARLHERKRFLGTKGGGDSGT